MDNMAKSYTYEIPEGYGARIEGNKVIIELAESEDERIRKAIVEILNRLPACYWYGQKEKDDCLAYLEKQKEQKPIKRPKFKIGDVVKFKGFGDEPADDTPLKIVGYDNELYLFDNGTTDLFSEQNLYELVEQNHAWSEEDESKIKDIIDYLECWNDFDHGSESFEEYRKRMEGNIQFMKSLRPSWKPIGSHHLQKED